MTFLNFRPGRGVLGPPRSLPRPSWGLPQGPQPIFLTFMTFLTVMTFLTFLTFLSFRPGMGMLGPPRSLLPRSSCTLPQGPQPIFLTFMTFFFYDFLTFMTFLSFRSGIGVLGPARCLPRPSRAEGENHIIHKGPCHIYICTVSIIYLTNFKHYLKMVSKIIVFLIFILLLSLNTLRFCSRVGSSSFSKFVVKLLVYSIEFYNR